MASQERRRSSGGGGGSSSSSSSSASGTPVKCVVLGDDGVGKTSLILRELEGEFHSGFVPLVHQSADPHPVKVGRRRALVELCDTASRENYELLRQWVLLGTNVAIVCFSVADPASAAGVAATWLPELAERCPGAKVVLVGTKTDLRDDEVTVKRLAAAGLQPLSAQDGDRLREETDAAAYLECSALTGAGVAELMRAAARLAMVESLDGSDVASLASDAVSLVSEGPENPDGTDDHEEPDPVPAIANEGPNAAKRSSLRLSLRSGASKSKSSNRDSARYCVLL